MMNKLLVMVGLVLLEVIYGQKVFRVTYRDFLPSFCLNESEYRRAWNWPVNDPTYDATWGGLTDAIYTNEDDLSGVTMNVDTFTVEPEMYCPYFPYMKNFSISAHPDFEAYSDNTNTGKKGFVTGPSCTVGCSDLTARVSRVVNATLEENTGGIPKPVYCTSSETESCGERGTSKRFTTTKKFYFDRWFNDDPVYNKRIGSSITLRDVGAGKFTFNSAVDVSSETPTFAPLNEFVDVSTQAIFPNPFEAPAWPSSLIGASGQTARIRSSKYWYCTEVHFFFRFTVGSSFKFSGDDDVFVFFNGKLAMDLGGLHSQLEDTLSLTTQLGIDYNMSEGELYDFDMFHCERKAIGSNFVVETTLSDACNVETVGETTYDSALDNAAPGTYQLGPLTTMTTNQIRLVDTSLFGSTAGRNAASFAFLKQQQNVGTGFRAQFNFKIGTQGVAEGLAFVIHDRDEGLKNIPQTVGENLGFKFLTNGMAVVVDMCVDRPSCTEQNIYLTFPDNRTDALSPNNVRRKWDTVHRRLDIREEDHFLEVVYYGGSPSVLEVYLDNSLYLRQRDFDIEQITGGRNAFVGFTTATGNNPADITISNFLVSTVEIEPSETKKVDDDLELNFTNVEVKADGFEQGEGLTLQTYDGCQELIEYGGFPAMKAIFFEIPDPNITDFTNFTYYNESLTPNVIENPIIQDNQDGTYTAMINTTVPGIYSVVGCYGESCAFSYSFVTNGDGVQEVAATPISGQMFRKDAAVTVIPLTASPTFAPTIFEPPPEGDDSVVMYAAIGGGSALFLFIVGAAVMVIFRKRWLRDKGFIESGKIHRLDRDIEYDRNDEFSRVGRQLLNTRQAINKERAATAPQAKGGQISVLVQENEELKEQVRINKMKQQQATTGTSSTNPAFLGSKSKKIFE